MNEYKTKSDNKNTTNEYRQIGIDGQVGVVGLFVSVYSSQDDNAKRFKIRRYYLPKGITKNYNIIINGKNVYDQAVNSDIKRYEETVKLTTGRGEDYTTECLLDYDYIK